MTFALPCLALLGSSLRDGWRWVCLGSFWRVILNFRWVQMKLKTLIVDDHPASVSMLKKMLVEHCECFVATSGVKAVELFEQALRNQNGFDVVLLDIVMPGIDGIETLKRMRRLELQYRSAEISLYQEEGEFARIIMQTSSEDPLDFLSSYKDGRCNGYINKPYSQADILNKVLGRRGNPREIMARL